LVAGGVEGGVGDVAGEAKHVEVGFEGFVYYLLGLFFGYCGEVIAKGPEVGAPQEDGLVVDAPLAVVHAYRAEPNVAGGLVAGGSVLVGDGEGYLVERLVAEFVGPPEWWVGYTYGPFDGVLAGGEGLLVAVVYTEDGGVEYR